MKVLANMNKKADFSLLYDSSYLENIRIVNLYNYGVNFHLDN
jgi:hypothetical protein